MGILNVTPDSFSDGGRYLALESAIKRGQQMAAEGADLIDIGGESTRPGASPITVQEELARVIPVIETLSSQLSIPLSIDTSKPEVMAEAIRAGAGFINDIYALRRPGSLEMAHRLGVPVCLMHMQGEPGTMQGNPSYHNVVAEVKAFLSYQLAQCQKIGIAGNRLIVDVGFGFGKTLQHNLLLLKHLDQFHELGVPILVGLSRKSMIGKVLDLPVEARVTGSLTATTIALWQGVRVIRTHDVWETRQAVQMAWAIQASSDLG